MMLCFVLFVCHKFWTQGSNGDEFSLYYKLVRPKSRFFISPKKSLAVFARLKNLFIWLKSPFFFTLGGRTVPSEKCLEKKQ